MASLPVARVLRIEVPAEDVRTDVVVEHPFGRFVTAALYWNEPPYNLAALAPARVGDGCVEWLLNPTTGSRSGQGLIAVIVG